MVAADVAKIINFDYKKLLYRLSMGWNVEQIVKHLGS